MTNATQSKPSGPGPDFFTAARFNMVESQLRPNRVLNPDLLEAMGSLPREAFVPAGARDFAYSDENISIGFGRHLLAPVTLARLIQELQITKESRVLDVGAGAGYAAAIMGALSGSVTALESDLALLRQLQQNRENFDLKHVYPVPGALSDGFAASAPYDAILIEGGIQWLPPNLAGQMAEGARLACVIYPQSDAAGRMGEARVYERRHGVFSSRGLFDASAPLLQGFAMRPKFVF